MVIILPLGGLELNLKKSAVLSAGFGMQIAELMRNRVNDRRLKSRS